MLSYFVNISDKYLKDGQNKKRVKGRGEKMEYVSLSVSLSAS